MFHPTASHSMAIDCTAIDSVMTRSSVVGGSVLTDTAVVFMDTGALTDTERASLLCERIILLKLADS